MTGETVSEPASAESRAGVLSVADAGLCGPWRAKESDVHRMHGEQGGRRRARRRQGRR